MVFEFCHRVQLLLNLNWSKQFLLLFPSVIIYLQTSSGAAEGGSHDELHRNSTKYQEITVSVTGLEHEALKI